MWEASGIPTPRYAMLRADTDFERVLRALGLPLIVKPAREGSTLGLTKVRTAADLVPAYELAARFDDLVLAEEFVEGQELTAGILGEKYIGLEPGAEIEHLKDGDEITFTQSAIVLENLISKYLFSKASGEESGK